MTELHEALAGLRQFYHRVIIVFVMIAMTLTMPVVASRWVPPIRETFLLFGLWEGAIRVCIIAWAAVVLLAVPPYLWAYRSRCTPALGRLLQAMWSLLRGTRRQPAIPSQPVEPPLVTTTPTTESSGLPPLDLLGPPARIAIGPCPEMANQVAAALQALGIGQVAILRHLAGPVVKVVEVKPAETVKSSQVIRLADDLAAQLGAQSCLISPVVGSPGVLSISIAGQDRPPVPFRALLDSKEFQASATLPVVVGVESTGTPLIADLAAMPHLLIAGTTGSGKSFFLRQIIVSLLYRHGPADLRLILVDPKVVEMSLFKGLPHLLRPIITKPAVAMQTLSGLVDEMERRYETFATEGATNLESYNRKNSKRRLPYIVMVIDELADLMEAGDDRKAVESAIQRLAQKARAAGIHLILATQRPSVDVITGTIKANIPCRASLRLASQVDSRTILDTGGAEKLRPKGELFFRPAADLIRAQVAAVTDDIVQRVVAWWQHPHEGAPETPPIVSQIPAPDPDETTAPTDACPPRSSTKDDEDLRRVKEIALVHGVVSRRLVEQELRVASARANELVRLLDSRGWLRPASGPKPRPVIWDQMQRKIMLADLRGVRPDEIELVPQAVPHGEEEPVPPEVAPSEQDAQASVSPSATPSIDLRSEITRIHHEAQAAIADRDRSQIQGVLTRLDQLIDLALDREDPKSFHHLSSLKRWLKSASQIGDGR